MTTTTQTDSLGTGSGSVEFASNWSGTRNRNSGWLLLLPLLCLLFGTSSAHAAEADGDRGGPKVTVALLPPGSDLSTLDRDQWAVGLMSAGMGSVSSQQTMLDIGQGARVTSTSYNRPLTVLKEGAVPRFLDESARRANSAPREIRVGALNRVLTRAGIDIQVSDSLEAQVGFSDSSEPDRKDDRPTSARQGELRVVNVNLRQLKAMRDSLGPDDALIAIESPGNRRLLDVAIAGEGFSGELESSTTHLVPLISTVDIAPTILDRFDVEPPGAMEGAALQGGGTNRFGTLAEVRHRLEEVRSQRAHVIRYGLAAIVAFILISGLVGQKAGFRFALGQCAVGLPLAIGGFLIVPLLGLDATASFLAVLVVASAIAWILRRKLGDLGAYAVASGLAIGTVAIDLLLGLDLVPYSVLGSNPIGGVRFFGIGNELESILACCLFLGVAAGLADRGEASASRAAGIFLVATFVVLLFVVPGRFGADVGGVVTLSAGAATACLLLLSRSWKLILAVCLAPLVLLGLLALIDVATGADSHFTRTILGAGSVGEVGDVLVSRLKASWHTVVAESYRLYLIATLVILIGLAWLSRKPDSPLRKNQMLGVGLYSSMVALLIGAIGNDSGTLLILAGAPFVFSYWAMVLTRTEKTADQPFSVTEAGETGASGSS